MIFVLCSSQIREMALEWTSAWFCLLWCSAVCRPSVQTLLHLKPPPTTTKAVLIRMGTALTRYEHQQFNQHEWDYDNTTSSSSNNNHTRMLKTQLSAPSLAVPPVPLLPPWLAASNFCCCVHDFELSTDDTVTINLPCALKADNNVRFFVDLIAFLKCYQTFVDVTQLVTYSFLLNI